MVNFPKSLRKALATGSCHPYSSSGRDVGEGFIRINGIVRMFPLMLQGK